MISSWSQWDLIPVAKKLICNPRAVGTAPAFTAQPVPSTHYKLIAYDI